METQFALSDRSTNIPSGDSTQGFVEFDFDNVQVLGLGTFRAKSKFPRVKPKHVREFVDDSEIEALCCSLMPWVVQNFETAGRENYFKENVVTSALLVAHIHPLVELGSIEFRLCFQFLFWLWIFDDVFEDATKKKVHFNELKKLAFQLESVMSGKYDSNPTYHFESVPDFPAFDELFYSLLNIHNSMVKHVPNYNETVKKPLNCFQEYFSALIWLNVDDINGRYSIDTFKNFRKPNSFVNGTIQIVTFVHGIKISDQIWNSFCMKQIEDLVNSISSFSNDLLGMRRDFLCENEDSLLYFMVVEKKIPLDSAVQYVCEYITNALNDYCLFKKTILMEFDCDENLVELLDFFDSLIDGMNLIYTEASRYRISTGSLLFTR